MMNPPRIIHDVLTPFVWIDLNRLRRNIDRLASLAKEAGIALRPHAKTHKIVEIGKMQMDAGAIGLTLAKVTEAEPFIQAGVYSVLVAFPVWDEWKIQRVIELGRRAEVLVGVDSLEVAQRMGELAWRQRREIDVLLIVDIGYHRFGVPTERAADIAVEMARIRGIRFRGIKTYYGKIYSANGRYELEREAEYEVTRISEVAQAIRRRGVDVEIVSAGSTPSSYTICRKLLKGVTELRAGNYVFHDRMQLRLGIASEDDCALRVIATVISKPEKGRALIDAGMKTLTSTSCGGDWTGYGQVVGKRGIEIYNLSEEAGWLRISPDGDDVRIGERLEIIPNHACEITNLAEQVYAGTNGRVEKIWTAEARGKVI